jgi:hypothetical protein
VKVVSNFGWTFFGGGAFDLRLPILLNACVFCGFVLVLDVTTTTRRSSFPATLLRFSASSSSSSSSVASEFNQKEKKGTQLFRV